MSTSTGVAGDMEKAGVSRIVERKYRHRVYTAARYYLTWYFLGSLIVTIVPIITLGRAFIHGGLEELEPILSWNLAGVFAGLYLCILSSFMGTLADSDFAIDGDRGIYSLGSRPATAPVVTTSTFICDTPQAQALYPAKYHGMRITRRFVHRWMRKGGNIRWPGAAGGKKEGYISKVVYSWDEAELVAEDGTVTVEAIDTWPCPTCNPNRTISNREAYQTPGFKLEGKCGKCGETTKLEVKSETLHSDLGFVKVPPLSDVDLRKLAMDAPGIKRGGVLDLRGEVVANRYIDELPWELADAIRNDVEFRASSRVDMIWDETEKGGGMGLPQNAAIELFGLEFTSKQMRARGVSLHQTIAQQSQLVGPLGGSGSPP